MMLKDLLLVFIVSMVHSIKGQVLEDTFISFVCPVNVGCMRGSLMRGYNIPFFEAFMGIPYARPPVGHLRFSNPRKYPKWTSVYKAVKAKPDCIQKNYLLPTHPVSGSEDCLYLNVYRPMNISTTRRLPVMIYIHGGGWFSGSANPNITGPEYLMDTEEVILVTFAYRLGAFGFLSTGDESMPGNFGLKDQLLAIKWVHNNIEAFGGDPAKVTLFGQSAGAVSAHMHMLSARSRGLFQGVIALSGTANVPFAINDSPLEQTIRVAKLCGIENAEKLNTKELLRALKAVDKDTILKAGDSLKFWSVDHMTNYRPVVEPANVKDAFFTTKPEELLKSGAYQAVPFMLGTVPQEGAVRALAIMESQDLRESFNKDFFKLLKTFLDFPKHFNALQLNYKTRRIIQEYFKGEQELNNHTRQAFLDLVTDRGFHHPFYNTIKYFLNTKSTRINPIYLYSFNYTSRFSYSTLYTGGLRTRNAGAVHCDELIYLFRTPVLFPDFPKHSRYTKALEIFIGNIVHFAKYQKPLLTAAHKRCEKSTFHRRYENICDYQLFENDSSNRLSIIVRTDNKFNVKRMQFWEEILNDTN